MPVPSSGRVAAYFLVGLGVFLIIVYFRGDDEKTRRAYLWWKALSLVVLMAWMLWESYRALTGP